MYADWPLAEIGGALLPARNLTVQPQKPGPVSVVISELESAPYTGSVQRAEPRVPRDANNQPIPEYAVQPELALPSAPVYVMHETVMRGVRMATIAVSPVFEQAGEVRIATRLAFAVDGATYLVGDSSDLGQPGMARLAALSNLSAAPQGSSATTGALARATGADAGLACTNNLPMPLQPLTDAASNVAMRNNMWRADVSTAGMQIVTASALISATDAISVSVPVATIPVGKFQVWRGGVQLAIDVIGNGGSGTLGSGGEIRFYAADVGDRWNPSDRYWVIISDAQSKRVATTSLALSGGAQSTALEEGVWRDISVYESQFAGPAGDFWYSRRLATNASSQTVNFSINGVLPYASSGGSTTITANLARRTTATYTAWANVNGSWSSAAVSGNATGSWSPSWVIANGGSSAQFMVQTAVAGETELQDIHWQRTAQLNFNGNGARFLTGAGSQRYTLSGLPSGATLYDVTSPQQPQIVPLSGSDFQSPGDHRYALVNSAGAPRPSVSKYVYTSDLSAPRAGDAVYISPQDFFGQVQRLTAFRANQGYKTQIIDLQQIYDWWSDGNVSPEAVRSFLRYAYATWSVKPLGVTLVGDGSHDPMDRNKADIVYFGVNYNYTNLNITTPYMANADYYVGEVACDTCFVRFDCDDPLADMMPDAYIGRLSVIDNTQLGIVIDKILAYETSTEEGTWRSRFMFFADNDDAAGSFVNSNARVMAQLPQGVEVSRNYYVSPSSPVTQSWQTNNDGVFKSRTTTQFSDGGAVAFYNGHGAWTSWAGNPILYYLGDPYNISNPNTRLPFLLEMACYTSAFSVPLPDYSTLDEQMQRAASGPVAVWGPTGEDVIASHDRLAQGLNDLLWSPSTIARSKTFGEMTMAGYGVLSTFWRLNSLWTYVLLGDPLTKLRAGVPRTTPAQIYMGTLAGHLDGSSGSTDGQNANAAFTNPTWTAVSPDGAFALVSDSGNHTIRRVELVNGVVTTIAGQVGVPGSQNGSGASARFNHPAGVAISPDGQYAYVADSANGQIRRINLANNSVSSIAFGFGYPVGIAATADNLSLYVTDAASHTVKRVILSTLDVQSIAGVDYQSGWQDGNGGVARFSSPGGIGVSGDATFAIVADTGNHVLRRINLTSAQFPVTTLAGSPGQIGATNGSLGSARFSYPTGVALTGDGRMAYVTDAGAPLLGRGDTANGGHTIRQIDLRAGTVSTVSGVSGLIGRQNGVGSEARYDAPIGIALSPDEHRLVVGDSGNNLLRSVGFRAVSPGSFLPAVVIGN